jgi:hypothetical protein
MILDLNNLFRDWNRRFNMCLFLHILLILSYLITRTHCPLQLILVAELFLLGCSSIWLVNRFAFLRNLELSLLSCHDTHLHKIGGHMIFLFTTEVVLNLSRLHLSWVFLLFLIFCSLLFILDKIEYLLEPHPCKRKMKLRWIRLRKCKLAKVAHYCFHNILNHQILKMNFLN